MAAIFTALYLKMLTWDFAREYFSEYSDTLGDISAKTCLLSKSLHFTCYCGNYDWPNMHTMPIFKAFKLIKKC